MTPIAQWLKDTRLRQTNPDTGRPWSQEYLVELIRSETGWNLYRPNYVQYEAGKQRPEPDTLQRFIDFWQAHGEAGPDLTPQPEPLSLEERAVIAAEGQAATLAELLAEQIATNRLMAARLDALEALVATLTAPTLADPQALEAMRSWGRDALDRSRTRVQRPDQLRVTE